MAETILFFFGTFFGFAAARYYAWAQGAEYSWMLSEAWSKRVLTYLVWKHGDEYGCAYIEALNATRYKE